MKCISHALQRTAHRGLAEQQARCRARYVSFFGKNREDHQQVQICLS
jgi:hypothetical protein